MIRLARAATVIACALALGGCVSLLPKSKPAHLYRFDGMATAAAPAASSEAPAKAVAVLKGRGAFDPAAAGDRILTLDGQQVAYIAEARWAAPALVLFDQAISRAFDANAGPARLIGRGQISRAQYVLQVDVRDFAAVYDTGPQSVPTVLVRVRATLMRVGDRSTVAEQMFEAKVRAGDNRVSAIAQSFERAVGDVLGKVIDWTNSTVAAPAATS